MKWNKRFALRDILLSLAGVFLISMGAAFNNCCGLGNDSIGILYDGLRASMNWTTEQLGTASNIVNTTILVLLFILSRLKYVSLGTLIYFLPYGIFMQINVFLYEIIPFTSNLWMRIALCVIGNLALYFGVSVYVTVDMGVDPFTGLTLYLRDITKKEYRYVKIAFDATLLVIGFLLGGKLGAVTIVSTLVAGPIIQFMIGRLQRVYFKKDLLQYKNDRNDEGGI